MTSKSAQKSKASPTRPRTPRHTPGTWMLFSTSVLCMALGTLIAVGPHYLNGVIPDVSWYAKIIARMGFNGETIGALGAVLFGLGILSRQLRAHTATQLIPTDGERMLEQLCTVVGDMNKRLKSMEKQNGSAAKQRLAIMETVQQQHQELVEVKSADPQNDAMFRLAASLDQLGARVDKRIGESTAVLQDGMFELSSLVETSRDCVTSGVENTAQQLTSLINEATYASDDELPATEPDHTPERYAVVDQVEEETNESDLDVYVEFEEQPQEEDHGLGLLDQIGDDGSISMNADSAQPSLGQSIELDSAQAPLPSPQEIDDPMRRLEGENSN